MAYYFMVESKKGKHLPLDIKSSIYFQPTKTKYDKPCACSLDEIDGFTMMFDNESELRHVLMTDGILTMELLHKPLTTRFLRNGKYEKIRYDFLFQKDLEYVAEPLKVVEYIMKKYHQNDFVFLQKFARIFSNYRECSTTAPEVAQSSAASIREGRRHYLLESVDKNGDLLVARLVKLIILKHTELSDGTINYKDEVNYRNLHSVIMFINNYEKKQEEQTEKIIEPPSIELEPTASKVKKRKIREEIDGQISFPI